ncbi:MAG: acyl-CoA dehydrogenase family protein [Nitrospinae bacterium]|nr:acyl-CoA dehydrogenase family protein [Nitrospinota bacterium]
MDFTLTEAHQRMRTTVREFAEKEIAPLIPELDARGEHSTPMIRSMGKRGLLGICLPERYGGLGEDYISFGLACEELERVDTSARVVLAVHTALNSLTLLQWGTEEQKHRYLVPQARGEKIAAYALTEPGAGSDAAAIESTACRQGDHYLLNGSKFWISLADVADHFLVFAYTDKSKGHHGISAFIVERGFGISSGTIKGKLGVRAGNTGGLFLKDVPVPAENLLGQEGEGFKIAMSALDNGRYTLASGAVGIICACLEASVQYANERKTFGRPIGEHQLVQRMIAKMVAARDSGRLLYYHAGWLKNQGIRHTRETALAKWVNCNAAFEAANDAIQIHGANGYFSRYPVERYFRNARGTTIYEGTNEIHELLQAQYALGYRQDKPLRCTLPPWPSE